VNIADARSVIVLAADGGDAAVVKTILAIKILDPDFSNCNVVAEFVIPSMPKYCEPLPTARSVR